MTSDHKFIEFVLPFVKNEPKPKVKEITYRDFKNIDQGKFCEDIEHALNRNDDFFTLDVDSAASVFNDTLCMMIDKHAPNKTLVVKNERKPFMDDALITLRREKRQFERKSRKYKNPEDKDSYSKLIKDFRKKVKMKRSNFYQSKLESFKGNKKQTFKIFNSLLGNNTTQVLPNCESNETLCHDFEQHFYNKIQNIRYEVALHTAADGISANTDQSNTNNCKNNIKYFPKFSPLNDSELNKIVHAISNKCCVLDPLPPDLFKECLPFLLPYLKYIVNTSLCNGIFPTCYKKAVIKPSLKNYSLDQDLLSNYRPISNICFFSKVLERCVLNQLIVHLESNGCFGEFQSAYRKFHSCETAITRISNDILCSLDDKHCTFLLFLDLSAAFDTVDHKILLSNLKLKFNIDETALNWFQSYLYYRSYFVNIDQYFSNGIWLLFGVPQGSILGPILFILYMSEIEIIAKRYGFRIHIYADDTQLYISFKHVDVFTTVSDIEYCLRDIKNWMSENFLKINEDKTKFLLISANCFSPTALSDMCISFAGNVISPSLDAVNLGVTFDSTMSMHSHINDIVSKGYYHLSNFWRLADKLTVDLKLTLVTSYIIPLIDYCNIIFYAANETHVYKLQKLLNSAVRFIYNLTGKRRRLSITPYLKKLHILPVRYRMKYKVALLVYKSLHDLAPTYIKELMEYKVTYSHLRSSNKLFALQTSTPKSSYGESSFAYVAPNVWNELSKDIVCSPTLEIFKRRLKTHYYTQCFENI